MSHTSVFQTGLTCTEEQALAAIEDLANQIHAQTFKNRLTTRYISEKILIGIRSGEVPDGIGVRVVNGKLEIIGDPWGQEVGYKQMQKWIKGYVYAVNKIKANAKRLKLPVKTVIHEKELLLTIG